jgi:hypothetical protein
VTDFLSWQHLGWLYIAWILVGIGMVGGALIVVLLTRHRLHAINEREAKVAADFQALRTAQRLNVAFMEARRLMWEEAIRRNRRPSRL